MVLKIQTLHSFLTTPSPTAPFLDRVKKVFTKRKCTAATMIYEGQLEQVTNFRHRPEIVKVVLKIGDFCPSQTFVNVIRSETCSFSLIAYFAKSN